LREWRNLVCGVMIVVMPASLIAQASGGAMLHSDGGVWLNGNLAPNSSAIFPHDVIQTQKDHQAKIDADGSTVTVQPDTIVQFEGDEIVLDHGSVQVNTSRGMKVRVNCMTVIPVTQEWTRYDVIDVDGKMRVVAYQNDVNIHYQVAVARRSKPGVLSDATVHQGEQTTREERCGVAARPAEIIDAKAAILNSTWAKLAGGGALVSICIFLVCRGDDPISPSKP
jgi:hypothetical protein